MAGYSVLFETSLETEGELRIGPVSLSTAEMFGAALRRVLMTQVPGSAVSAIRIEGAGHEFALVDGVVEDVAAIVENLKKVRLRLSGAAPTLVTISVAGPATVTSGDLAAGSKVQVANPSQLIATIGKGGQLDMVVEVSAGSGYESVQADGRPGWVEIDRTFSPVRSVRMKVTEEEEGIFLSLTVFTAGAVRPADATTQAATALAAREVESNEVIRGLCQAVAAAADRPAPADEVSAALSSDGEALAPATPRVREFGSASALPMPNLTEFPVSSYQALLQPGLAPLEREPRGFGKTAA